MMAGWTRCHTCSLSQVFLCHFFRQINDPIILHRQTIYRLRAVRALWHANTAKPKILKGRMESLSPTTAILWAIYRSHPFSQYLFIYLIVFAYQNQADISDFLLFGKQITQQRNRTERLVQAFRNQFIGQFVNEFIQLLCVYFICCIGEIILDSARRILCWNNACAWPRLVRWSILQSNRVSKLNLNWIKPYRENRGAYFVSDFG